MWYAPDDTTARAPLPPPHAPPTAAQPAIRGGAGDEERSDGGMAVVLVSSGYSTATHDARRTSDGRRPRARPHPCYCLLMRS